MLWKFLANCAQEDVAVILKVLVKLAKFAVSGPFY